MRRRILAPLCLALAAPVEAEQPHPDAATVAMLKERARAWIEEGFSPGDAAETFSFERYLADFYAVARDDLALHDDNDPQMRIATNARDYGRIWEELFAGVDAVTNHLVKFHQVEVDGGLGLTSFTADAVVRAADGTETVFPVFYTLTWRPIDGAWRIVHEHGSSLVPAASPVAAAAAPDAETEVARLTERWVEAWDVDDGRFDPHAFDALFAPGEGAIKVFDNVEGDVIVIESLADYRTTWAPFMAPLAHWSVRLEDLEITVGDAVALTTFRLVGDDTRDAEGRPISFGQYGTHVWRNLPGHGWRIVHEHLTSFDVEGTREEEAPADVD